MPSKFKLRREAIRELLTSPQVEAELRRRAERVAAEAGPGHVVDSQRGKRRARAAVITANTEAIVAEARTRNLTRALNAGRG